MHRHHIYKRLKRNLAHAFVLLLAISVVGCTQKAEQNASGDWFRSLSKQTSWGSGLEANTASNSSSPQQQAFYYEGTGQTVGNGSSAFLSLPENQGGSEPVTLNLVNAPIDAAAKSVLGDTLRLNYSIDPAVTGKITVQTSSPVSRPELARLFQSALSANNAAIIHQGGAYFRIVTAEQARNTPVDVEVGAEPAGAGGAVSLGTGMKVVPLKYVAASEMQRILEPMIGESSIVSADDTRNVIILAGTAQETDTILKTISIFDVDMMRGKSVLLVQVQAPPEALVADLKGIFGAENGGMKGIVQFLPNERLKSILVVSSQPSYLSKAEMWIRRLDTRAQGNDKQLFTYKVQNRQAKNLVTIINDMFSTSAKGGASARHVAPRFEQSSLSSDEAEESQSAGDTGIGVASGAGGFAPSPSSTDPGQERTSNSASSAGDGEERVRVTADEAENSLLILATPADYKRVLAILHKLDTARKQVLIEATIAEVSLRDELEFGVRWYFRGQRAEYQFTDAAARVLDSTFPGFSYAWQVSNIQATLSALNKITRVNIVSAPSLMVVDNMPATLQIGDQVPIVTQSAAGVLAPGAPVVNSVNYRDTGVILSITPRINDKGRVLLTIQQEVSSVANTTSSNIDSPTIRQRKIKTTVMVNDNEALALGGIIQTQLDSGRSQVPLLGDIPLLGNAFKQKTNTDTKTELIVLITPRIVRDPAEANAVTEEYRRRLNVFVPSPKNVEHSVSNTAKKVLE